MVSINIIFKIVLVVSILLLAGLILKTGLFAGIDNREALQFTMGFEG